MIDRANGDGSSDDESDDSDDDSDDEAAAKRSFAFASAGRKKGESKQLKAGAKGLAAADAASAKPAGDKLGKPRSNLNLGGRTVCWPNRKASFFPVKSGAHKHCVLQCISPPPCVCVCVGCVCCLCVFAIQKL